MTEFLVELYRSHTETQAAAADCELAGAAAETLTGSGRAVRLVRSFFVPDDETCFLLFEAESADSVRDVMALAGLPCDEVHETTGQATGPVPADRTHLTLGDA
jgi:hypothetical protein